MYRTNKNIQSNTSFAAVCESAIFFPAFRKPRKPRIFLESVFAARETRFFSFRRFRKLRNPFFFRGGIFAVRENPVFWKMAVSPLAKPLFFSFRPFRRPRRPVFFSPRLFAACGDPSEFYLSKQAYKLFNRKQS
jgi:hypothetical protein